jgi:uncharacterized protein (DUF1800 family)
MRRRDKIEHFLRRTGFGVTSEERRRGLNIGYRRLVEETIQSALTYRVESQPPVAVAPAVAVPVTLLTFGQGVSWWFNTMVKTPTPLAERMTMFWHRHFATGGQKVFRPGWMFAQNMTFRRDGFGPFADLLKAMVADPAMLNWLDAHNNPVDNPNENLARELLELFTLGRGHYTEHDVKQMAKLTTGRRLAFGGRSVENPRDAYQGPVDVVGFRGQYRLEEMAEKLAVHPSTAKRMVEMLWEDFAACPLPDPLSERWTALWCRTRGNVAIILKEMFLSEKFFAAPLQRVNSPVEYWVSCARLLEWNDFNLTDSGALNKAGELLFFPPSVKGWNRGTALIHPAAMQIRLEITERMVASLNDNHFALQGLSKTPDRALYLQHMSGGQIERKTLPSDLQNFSPREALLLGLSSPDLWMS